MAGIVPEVTLYSLPPALQRPDEPTNTDQLEPGADVHRNSRLNNNEYRRGESCQITLGEWDAWDAWDIDTDTETDLRICPDLGFSVGSPVFEKLSQILLYQNVEFLKVTDN